MRLGERCLSYPMDKKLSRKEKSRRLNLEPHFNHYPWVSRSVVSNSLWSHGLQHTGLPRPTPTPRTCSNSCPSSSVITGIHLPISSSVVPFSSCLQSFPGSGSFQMSQFFASGGQSIEASTLASVLPMKIQDWSPLGRTGLISLQSKGLSRVFINTTVQKHQLQFKITLE